jgi:DNA-binding response OmpR family regulator
VSHEFRTPLTLIIGPLEEILTREGNYTVMGKKLKMVYKNAHKLLNLINKLLDYRKVETGNMVLRVKEDNIVSFCEEIFITFKELAIRKNIKFGFHADHSVILTWFDKEKLEMVLNNILSNSFKYIGKGNAITITVKKQQEHNTEERIVIEIKDDGIGIPKDQLKYIFDWYYQADNKSPVSSGIGLALAKKLVYLHKGQIWVTSAEGQGSAFTIKLPIGREHFKSHEIVVDERSENLIALHEAVQLTEPEENGTEGTRKKGLKNVLIVEDDDDVRNFLKDYFETRYKVYEASNGKDGLTIAEEANLDLIISDVMMPEMNGVDFCKQIKNVIKTSHIPVILLTAKTSFTHHKEGLEIGADAYITKPFSPEMLGLTVENLLQSQENLIRFYRSCFIKNGNGAQIKEAVSLDEKLLQRVYDFVRANLENANVNLDDVCDELGVSRSLLYKKIKFLTGLSPVEYIRSLRLGEAASLLKSQKYKVFEVVYMVGFSDIKYFRQCFQKEFGYSPSSLLEKQ